MQVASWGKHISTFVAAHGSTKVSKGRASSSAGAAADEAGFDLEKELEEALSQVEERRNLSNI